MRTVLQVPMSKELRRAAEKQAKKMGFSTLQDAVRFFLKKLADGKVEIKVIVKDDD